MPHLSPLNSLPQQPDDILPLAVCGFETLRPGHQDALRPTREKTHKLKKYLISNTLSEHHNLVKVSSREVGKMDFQIVNCNFKETDHTIKLDHMFYNQVNT